MSARLTENQKQKLIAKGNSREFIDHLDEAWDLAFGAGIKIIDHFERLSVGIQDTLTGPPKVVICGECPNFGFALTPAAARYIADLLNRTADQLDPKG